MQVRQMHDAQRGHTESVFAGSGESSQPNAFIPLLVPEMQSLKDAEWQS